MFTDTLSITQAGKIGIADVAHVVDTHLMIKLGSQQGRVLLYQVNVIIDNSEVVTTQTIHMARSRHIQEIIGCRLGTVIGNNDECH